MRLLMIAALATLAGTARLDAAAPVPAAKAAADGPPLILQIAPVGQLVADLQAAAKVVAGDMAADHIKQAVEGKLGAKGFAGLDPKKPITAYMLLPNEFGLAGKKPQDINPEEIGRKFKGAVVVPVTTEAEFKEFVPRLFGEKVGLTPIDGKDGLFKMDHADHPAPFPVRVRFSLGHAYVGLNMTDEEMDAKALPTPESLVNPKEKAQVAVRMITDRYPPGLLKEAATSLDDAIEQAKTGPAGARIGAMESMIVPYVKLAKRYSDQIMKETTEVGYRLAFDPASAEAAYEFYIVPKKGTPLAADIADRKAATNTFAGLLGDKMVAGAMVSAPLFAPELREMFAALAETALTEAKTNAPPPAVPVLEELLKGLGRTVKTGTLDLAAAVTGPDKDGHFAAVAAVSFDDAPALEKAVKTLVKEGPAEVGNVVTIDAEKVGDLKAHKITLPPGGPQELQKIFGSTSVYVVFAPKAVYAAVGADALANLKAAIAAKPGPARALDLVINPSRVQQLVTASNEEAGKMVGQVIGTEDKKMSAAFVEVLGGDGLRVRVGVSLKVLPKLAAFRAMEGRAGPPAAAAPIPVKD